MASTYLQRTPSVVGNRKTFTLSTWIKRADISNSQYILYGGSGSGNESGLLLGSSGQISYFEFSGGYTVYILSSNKYRDVGAFYHIVLKVDTTQATASDRVKIYVNGSEITYGTATYPSQNFDSYHFNNTSLHTVGASGSPSVYFDGLMSHFHWIDGTAYDASAFGETDATTGIWKPKTEPSVTYGTNGFFLKFENSGSMGTDSSPNGNDFAVNGNLTQTVDTPSNVFCTMNPLITGGLTLSNGNLTGTTSTTSTWVNMTSTLATSKGKYYFEVKKNDTMSYSSIVGITSAEQYGSTNNNKFSGSDANGFGFYYNGLNALWYSITNGTNSSFGSSTPSPSNGDIYMCAVDLDNNYIYFGINGTWHNSGNPESGATGTGGINISSISGKEVYFCATNSYNTSGTSITNVNFGNGYFGTTAVSSATSDESGLGIFEYTVPSGYYALCTKNINEQEYD